MAVPSLQNVADVFVAQLEAWGVKFVYGIPGGSILPTVDAIRRSGVIKFVLVRHEETAAFMASAYAKLTGRIGVCTAITGAGATNLMTGLADAAWDRAPVLAITGQVEQELIGSGVFQEIDQYGLFSSLCVYNQVLQDAAQLGTVLPAAMKSALLHRGVAHIGLPINLQKEAYYGAVVQPGDLLPPSGTPHPSLLESAVRSIRRAKRIVILAGSQAWSAREEIAELSEKLAAPVATTPSAKGLFDDHRPESVGVLGRLGLSCSMEVFEQSELAILVGADIVEQRLLPRVPTIQITVDPIEVASELSVDAILAGDVKLIIRDLLNHLSQTRLDGWENWAVTNHTECLREAAEALAPSTRYIHPKLAIEALASVISDDAIISVDIGDITYWYMQYFRSTRQRTLVSSHLASMGFAFPAALAAKLEHPELDAVCIAGDGGFAMSMADFTTAVKYNLPVVVLLLNNHSYNRVAGEQSEAGISGVMVDLVNPDFASFAEGCGGEGYRVEHTDDIAAVLRSALRSGKPSIVEVITDSSIHAVPTLTKRRTY